MPKQNEKPRHKVGIPNKASGKNKKNKKLDLEKVLPSLEEMLKQGIHFGHRTSRWNVKMDPYIFTARKNVHIIDLEKSREKLGQALEYLYQLKQKNATILFVGTKVSAKEIVKQIAEEINMPYVNERWLGGTLTNFPVISKRLEHYRDLEAKMQSGEMEEKYTKKERHDFNVELQRLKLRFGGMKKMTQLPDALLVVDTHKENLAVKEARMQGIPVIGLCDTNADPSIIDYPIPTNDDAISALKLILGTIQKVLE